MRGRGKGREESVQHKVLKKYLSENKKDLKLLHEEDTALKRTGPKKYSMRADFVLLNENKCELIECKWSCHRRDFGMALGQLLVYRELRIAESPEGVSEEVKPTLSLGLASGYGVGEWGSPLEKIVEKLSSRLNETITIYLVKPKEGKEDQSFWEDSENHEVEKKVFPV